MAGQGRKQRGESVAKWSLINESSLDQEDRDSFSP